MSSSSTYTARGLVVITPSNTGSLSTPARALYVGGAGTISIQPLEGAAVTLVGVPAGALLPISVTRVNVTGTTATNLVGLL